MPYERTDFSAALRHFQPQQVDQGVELTLEGGAPYSRKLLDNGVLRRAVGVLKPLYLDKPTLLCVTLLKLLYFHYVSEIGRAGVITLCHHQYIKPLIKSESETINQANKHCNEEKFCSKHDGVPNQVFCCTLSRIARSMIPHSAQCRDHVSFSVCPI